MEDERCRITVVGARRRVDLAVPARAPIAEYVPELSRLCGQETDETFPASWSLAPAGARPIPPGVSLLEAQVVDGATLYLRDVVEGETDEPVVTDLGDLAEEVRGGWDRWNARHRVFTTIGIGLAVLVGAVALQALASPDSPIAAFIAIIAGSTAALLGGAALRGGWAVPAPLRAAVAMAACPLFALAGYVIPTSANATAAGTIAGAVIGALAAALAVPEVCTLLLLLATMIAFPVAILLAVVDATYVESAAVTGVIALITLSAAPGIAGRLATLPPVRGDRAAPDPAREVAIVMGRGRGALITIAVTVSLVAAACVLVLGDSTDPFAIASALCVSLALLAQAGDSEVPVAVMSRLAAGCAGIAGVALRAPVHLLHLNPTLVTLTVCAVGGAVLGIGCGMAGRSAPARTTAERPAWLGTLGTSMLALSVPLAAGVFGLFGDLARLGGRI
jgi:type VII secretion integral membrane protein EccD